MDDVILLMAATPVAGGLIGMAAVYVFDLRREIDSLIARVNVLESDVNFLFAPDDPDPDEDDVPLLPQNVVAIGTRKRR